MSNDLERYFYENDDGLITKWKHYFEVYDRHFSRYRGSAVNVLEVGVFHGGSLQMWKHYFGPQATIYGLDINPDTSRLEDEQIHILIGDQADKSFLRRAASNLPTIDILIDDGGHTMRQQRNTFEVLFPLLASDGVYLCEDLHTSYWPEYGGGYRKGSSFVEYSKRLVDSLNAWHSRSRRLTVSEFTRTVHGMHFYDSIVVVERRPIDAPSAVVSGEERVQPYRRYAGTTIDRLPRGVKSLLRRLRMLGLRLRP